MHAVADVYSLAAAVSHWTGVIGIELFGVFVIVLGLVWSTSRFVCERMDQRHYDTYEVRIGRSILLGLEVVVAADIVKTIALELTLMSLALLAGLVLIWTFLSWTLVLEIEGCRPWQRDSMGAGSQVSGRNSGETNAPSVTSWAPGAIVSTQTNLRDSRGTDAENLHDDDGVPRHCGTAARRDRGRKNNHSSITDSIVKVGSAYGMRPAISPHCMLRNRTDAWWGANSPVPTCPDLQLTHQNPTNDKLVGGERLMSAIAG